MRAVPRLWEFYPGICITTEEKARKNLSQGKKNLIQGKKNLSQGKKNLSQVKKNLSQGKKNLSQVKKNLRVQYTYYQNTHILQNNIKPPHYNKTITDSRYNLQ